MSYENYPSASLVIDTIAIQLADGGVYNRLLSNVTNSKGVIADNGQTILIRNVDWRQVVGNSLYEKYNAFNLKLQSYSWLTDTSVGMGNSDWAAVNVTMEFAGGIMCLPQYNHLMKASTNECTVGFITLANAVTTSSSGRDVGQSNVLTVFKTSADSVCDILIRLRNLNSVSGLVNNAVMGHMRFFFDVVPILNVGPTR